MKRLLTLLFFAFFAISSYGQVVPNLPSGKVPFGTGLFRAPDGDIWAGSKFDGYTNLGNWQRVADSLGAKINWSDTTIIASKEWVEDQLDNNTIKPGEVKPSDLGYVSGGDNRVPLFSTDANIWQTPVRASQQVISSTIAIRHLSGRLKAGNAVDNDDVVTLRQLRDSINAIPSNQIFQSCVVRFNGEKWVVINDGTHVPMNIDSVTNSTSPSFNFMVYYGSSHIEDVGSVIGVIDESYASLGYFVGATVGLEYAAFRITAKGLYAKVFYDGDSWEMDSSQYNTVRPEAFSFSFNPANGNLTISHNDVIIPYDFLTVQSGSGYTPILVSKTYTSVTIRFEDNGSPVLIPDTNMIVEMYRNGVYHVKNSVMPFSIPTGSPNIWVQGMHVRQ